MTLAPRTNVCIIMAMVTCDVGSEQPEVLAQLRLEINE